MGSRRLLRQHPSSAEPWPSFHLATEPGPSPVVVGRRAPASSHSHCTGAGAGANKRKQFRKDLNVGSGGAAGPLHPSWFTCLALKLHFGVSKSEKETSSLRPAADPRPMPAWIQNSETELNGIFSFQDDDHYDKRDVPSLSKRAKTDEGLPPPAPPPPPPPRRTGPSPTPPFTGLLLLTGRLGSHFSLVL